MEYAPNASAASAAESHNTTSQGEPSESHELPAAAAESVEAPQTDSVAVLEHALPSVDASSSQPGGVSIEVPVDSESHKNLLLKEVSAGDGDVAAVEASPDASSDDELPYAVRAMVGECVRVMVGQHAGTFGFVTSVVNANHSGTFLVNVAGNDEVTLPRASIQRANTPQAIAQAMGSALQSPESPHDEHNASDVMRRSRPSRRRSSLAPPRGDEAQHAEGASSSDDEAPPQALHTSPARPSGNDDEHEAPPVAPVSAAANATAGASSATPSPGPGLGALSEEEEEEEENEEETQRLAAAVAHAISAAAAAEDAAAARGSGEAGFGATPNDTPTRRLADLQHWKAKKGTTLASSVSLAALAEISGGGSPAGSQGGDGSPSDAKSRSQRLRILKRLVSDAPLADVAKLRKINPTQLEAMTERQMRLIVGAAGKSAARTPRTRSSRSAGGSGASSATDATPVLPPAPEDADSGTAAPRRQSASSALAKKGEAGVDLSAQLEEAAAGTGTSDGANGEAVPPPSPEDSSTPRQDTEDVQQDELGAEGDGEDSPPRPDEGGSSLLKEGAALQNTAGFNWMWRWVHVRDAAARGFVVGSGHGFYTVRRQASNAAGAAREQLLATPEAFMDYDSGPDALLLRRSAALSLDLPRMDASAPLLGQPPGVKGELAKGRSKSSSRASAARGSSSTAGGAPAPASSAAPRNSPKKPPQPSAEAAAAPQATPKSDAQLAAELAANERRRSGRARRSVDYSEAQQLAAAAAAAAAEAASPAPQEGQLAPLSSPEASPVADANSSLESGGPAVAPAVADMGQGTPEDAAAAVAGELNSMAAADAWNGAVKGQGAWSGAATSLGAAEGVAAPTAAQPDASAAEAEPASAVEAPVPPVAIARGRKRRAAAAVADDRITGRQAAQAKSPAKQARPSTAQPAPVAPAAPSTMHMHTAPPVSRGPLVATLTATGLVRLNVVHTHSMPPAAAQGPHAHMSGLPAHMAVAGASPHMAGAAALLAAAAPHRPPMTAPAASVPAAAQMPFAQKSASAPAAPPNSSVGTAALGPNISQGSGGDGGSGAGAAPPTAAEIMAARIQRWKPKNKSKNKSKKAAALMGPHIVLLFSDGALRTVDGQHVPCVALAPYGYTARDLTPSTSAASSEAGSFADDGDSPHSEPQHPEDAPPADSTMYIPRRTGLVLPTGSALWDPEFEAQEPTVPGVQQGQPVQVFRVDQQALLRHPAVIAKAQATLSGVSAGAGATIRSAVEAAGVPGPVVPDSFREACVALRLDTDALSASVKESVDPRELRRGGISGGGHPEEEDAEEAEGAEGALDAAHTSSRGNAASSARHKRQRAAAVAKKRTERAAYHAAFTDYARKRGAQPLSFSRWQRALDFKDRLKNQVHRLRERMAWEARPDISRAVEYMDLADDAPPRGVLDAIRALEAKVAEDVVAAAAVVPPPPADSEGVTPESGEATGSAQPHAPLVTPSTDTGFQTDSDVQYASLVDNAMFASAAEALAYLTEEHDAVPFVHYRLGADRLRRAAAAARCEIASDSSSDEEEDDAVPQKDPAAMVAVERMCSARGRGSAAGTARPWHAGLAGPNAGDKQLGVLGQVPWSIRDAPAWVLKQELLMEPPLQDSCVSAAQPGADGAPAMAFVRVTTEDGEVFVVEAGPVPDDDALPPVDGRAPPAGHYGSPALLDAATRARKAAGAADHGNDDDSEDECAGVWGITSSHARARATKRSGVARVAGHARQQLYGGTAVDLQAPHGYCAACGCPKDHQEDRCWDPACYLCPLYALFHLAEQDAEFAGKLAGEVREALQAMGHDTDTQASAASPADGGPQASAEGAMPERSVQVEAGDAAPLHMPVPGSFPDTATPEVATLLAPILHQHQPLKDGAPAPSWAATVHFNLLFNKTHRHALADRVGPPAPLPGRPVHFSAATRRKHTGFPRRVVLSEPEHSLEGHGIPCKHTLHSGASVLKRQAWVAQPLQGSAVEDDAASHSSKSSSDSTASAAALLAGIPSVGLPRTKRPPLPSVLEEAAHDKLLRQEHGEAYEYASAHAFGSLPAFASQAAPCAGGGLHALWEAACADGSMQAPASDAAAAGNSAKLAGYLRATRPDAGEDWSGAGHVPFPGGTHGLVPPGYEDMEVPPLPHVRGGHLGLHSAAAASRQSRGALLLSGPGSTRLGHSESGAEGMRVSAGLKPSGMRHPPLYDEDERLEDAGGPALASRRSTAHRFGHIATAGGAVVAGVTAAVPAALQYEHLEAFTAGELVQQVSRRHLDHVVTIPPAQFDAAGVRLPPPPPTSKPSTLPQDVMAWRRLLGVGHRDTNPLALLALQQRLLASAALEAADGNGALCRSLTVPQHVLASLARTAAPAALSAAGACSLTQPPAAVAAAGAAGAAGAPAAAGAATGSSAGKDAKMGTEVGSDADLNATETDVAGLAWASAAAVTEHVAALSSVARHPAFPDSAAHKEAAAAGTATGTAAADDKGADDASRAHRSTASTLAARGAVLALGSYFSGGVAAAGTDPVPAAVRGVTVADALAGSWNGTASGVVGVGRGVKRGRLGDALTAAVSMANGVDAAQTGATQPMPYGAEAWRALDDGCAMPTVALESPQTAEREGSMQDMVSLLCDAPVKVLGQGHHPRSTQRGLHGEVMPVQVRPLPQKYAGQAGGTGTAPEEAADTASGILAQMRAARLPVNLSHGVWKGLLPPAPLRDGPNSAQLAALGVPLQPGAAAGPTVVLVRNGQGVLPEAVTAAAEASAGPRSAAKRRRVNSIVSSMSTDDVPQGYGLAPATADGSGAELGVHEGGKGGLESDAAAWRSSGWRRGDEWQHPDLDGGATLMQLRHSPLPRGQAVSLAESLVKATELCAGASWAPAHVEPDDDDASRRIAFQVTMADGGTVVLPDAYAAFKPAPAQEQDSNEEEEHGSQGMHSQQGHDD